MESLTSLLGLLAGRFFLSFGRGFAVVNPLFPALRSAPTAVSGASRQKQIPSSQQLGPPTSLNTFKHLPILLLLAAFSQAYAGIDSGGGHSSDGIFMNHSSIGASFATIKTHAGSSQNQLGLIEVLYPVTPSSITDIDQNGVPDGWEIRNFGMIGVVPTGDADSDGASNLLEYLAGTNPNAASSVFRPKGSYIDGLFQIPVQTTSGRNYQIWASRDLRSWTLQRTLIGDDAIQVFEFDETTITSGPLYSSAHPSSIFFRVQILVPSSP